MESGVGSRTGGGRADTETGWSGLFLALVLCGFSLHRSWGQFEPVACLAMIICVGITWIVLIKGSFTLDFISDSRNYVSILTLLFAFSLWIKPNVYHFSNFTGFDPFRLQSFSVILGLLVGFQALNLAKNLPPFKGYTSYTISCILILFAGGVIISLVPRPVIDVHLFNTIAAEQTLHMNNMYKADYPDIYGGAYSSIYKFKQVFPYLPGTLIWSIPGFLWGDVRWGLWFLIAASMFIASKFQFQNSELLFLCPVIFYALECSLTDLGLLPLFLAGLYFLKEKSWNFAGIALGLAAANKQYAFLPLLLSTAAVYYSVSAKAGLRILFAGGATAIIFVLPWILSDAPAFFQSAILPLVKTAPRLDALTLFSLANHYKFEWPKIFGIILSALSLVGSVAGAISCRGSVPFAVSLASASCYGTLFLCSPQAFGNYYFLVFLFLAFSLLEATCQKRPLETRAH